MQLADELGWFCQNRGYVREGRRWIELALARAPGAPMLDRARALQMSGFLAREMHDLEIAQPLVEESLRLYQQIGDLASQADALNVLSTIALSCGDSVTTDRLAGESIAMFRLIGQPLYASGGLLMVGEAAYLMHDGSILHLDIRNNKIWVQYDGTEEGIANRLVELGVPQEDIVLGFHPPYQRQYTNFSVG